MGSFFKKAIILRRLTNVSHNLVSDELHGLREFGEVMQKILPPVALKKHSKHFERSKTSLTIVIPPKTLQVRFRKFQKLLKFSPNPNGDDNKSDERAQRDEEVKKLQDLRQRTIDHNFHQESVWKALQERDEILGRKDDKSTKNDDDNNKEEK